jgi:hypothetical protein
MRCLQRLIATSVLIALSGAVAGCSGGVSSWDPMDMLDFIDTKKKLQGERKPVFPEGVPGLEQGVPKALYKGAQETDQQNAQAAAAAAQPAQDTKSKRTAKSKSKQPAAAASGEPAATPDEDATPAAPADPKPKKIVRQRTTAPPADQPGDAQSASQQAQPAQPTQQSAAPFPAPMPSGSFSH